MAAPGAPGGGSGPVGAGGAEGHCTFNDERATIAVSSQGVDAGAAIPDRDETLEGAIRSIALDQFTIDTCPPTADCDASTLRTVTISAPGLDLTTAIAIPNDGYGPFARVRYVRKTSFDSMSSIVVTSLPSWGGIENRHLPQSGPSGLYVAAVDGDSSPIDAPYTVGVSTLACFADFIAGSCGSMRPGAYTLLFTDKTGNPQYVGMGQTQSLWLDGGHYTAKNLRSYVTGACESPYAFSNWVVGFPESAMVPGD